MSFMQNLRILWERLFPPTYPEYSEYKGDDSRDATTKLRRLQFAVVLIAVLSIPLSYYIYFVRTPIQEKPAQRWDSATAKEMLRSKDVFGKKEEDLDDIKRWADEVYREVEASLADTLPSSMYYGATAVNDNATEDYSDELAAILVQNDTSRATASPLFAGVEFDEPGLDDASASHGAATPDEYSSSYASPSNDEAATSYGDGRTTVSPQRTYSSFSSAAYEASEDTSGRDYRPRRYEPRTIEPRRVEPY